MRLTFHRLQYPTLNNGFVDLSESVAASCLLCVCLMKFVDIFSNERTALYQRMRVVGGCPHYLRFC